MFIAPKNLSLTLFVFVLVSLTVSSVDAHDFAQPNRRHDNLKRLVRKRSPALGLLNLAPDPNDPNANPGGLGDGLSASASASSASASASASDSAVSQSASDSASAVSSSSASSQSSAASDSRSASASSSSASAASTPSPSAPTPPKEPSTPESDPESSSSRPLSTVTKVNSVVGAVETSPPPPGQQSATSETKSTITTVIIAIAASVGGVAILWTVFRKWKLGHSKKFDERMAPIDWQPTNDDGIVPAHRRSPSRASSFTSSAHGHGAGYSDRLDHDFTAAASHLAPVGGYADLARGPSPQPQMQEAYDSQGLTRGPSTTRPGYDAGLPLHHQAGHGKAEAYDYNGDAIRF
ncbi:hypothetical protein R3P38DRAFT_2824036 [Favolaschia claudopus]|uniref:Uncharacterized protein n=1 Tax=Favolaschia claudopus TaxID=2862362 RepID=A0AAW0EHB8_9AGAR